MVCAYWTFSLWLSCMQYVPSVAVRNNIYAICKKDKRTHTVILPEVPSSHD